MDDSTPALEIKGLTKSFGNFIANDRIDLDIRQGELHALLGENGAGKSTLMNCLYGILTPDEGTIFRMGKQVSITNPNDAIQLGIGMVHQHFMLVEPFTVAENLILGREPVYPLGMLNRKKAKAAVKDLSLKYGLQVNPDDKIEDISVSAQQKVEILKALYRGAEVLILDEPTAVLTPKEIIELGVITRNLCSEGKSVILITHKLKEILSMADRCTVIRRGKKIETLLVKDTDENTLARHMVGREVNFFLDRLPYNPKEPALTVKDLSVKDYRGLPALKSLSFQVQKGEIFGIAGVDGNGQSELVNILSGVLEPDSGEVEINRVPVKIFQPKSLHTMGLSSIPEDRQKCGLVLEYSVDENLVLESSEMPPFSRGGFLKRGPIHEHGKALVERFDIRPTDSTALAGSLSGGNQQKVVIARAVSSDPSILLAAQPTRGLDVGAIEFVHKALLEQRDHGKAVLLVSLELDEILNLSDRILVLYKGRSQGIFDRAHSDENIIGRAMAGAYNEE